jgi:hypothetical protein
VADSQRPLVAARFSRFKSEEYLVECIEELMQKLDIMNRPRAPEELLIMKAQAIANLDIYFFPEPDKVSLAKDLVATIDTVDNVSFKCRPRKYSVVQQAFLQAKTNQMLKRVHTS